MRIKLRFQGPFRSNDELGKIRLYVNQLGDYQASARLHDLIRSNLENAIIHFGQDGELERSQWTSVDVSTPNPKVSGQNISWHPLELERWFFQLPEQDLFIDVDVPNTPRNWQFFQIHLDIHDWPSSIRLSPDAFKLYVVPAANVVRDFADPVLFDGTSESIAVRHPNRSYDYKPHSILGVYRAKDGEFQPLLNGLIADQSGTFRLLANDHSKTQRASRVSINLPEAFESPTTISVEALWHQPWFSEWAENVLKSNRIGQQRQRLSGNLRAILSPLYDRQIGEATTNILSSSHSNTSLGCGMAK